MNAADAFATRHDELAATAILEGSGSFVDQDADAPSWPATRLPADVLWQDHLPVRAPKWFVVADGRVDLRLGLVRIRERLGATRVIADSGGTLNASLLRARLVDILDVVTLPGLVGGAGTPTMMDGPQLDATELPLPAELIEVQTIGNVIRTRYRLPRV